MDILACSTGDLPACGYGIDFGGVTAIMLDIHDEDVHIMPSGLGKSGGGKTGRYVRSLSTPEGLKAAATQTGILHRDSLWVKAGIISLSSRSTHGMYRDPFQCDLIHPRLYQPWIE